MKQREHELINGVRVPIIDSMYNEALKDKTLEIVDLITDITEEVDLSELQVIANKAAGIRFLTTGKVNPPRKITKDSATLHVVDNTLSIVGSENAYTVATGAWLAAIMLSVAEVEKEDGYETKVDGIKFYITKELGLRLSPKEEDTKSKNITFNKDSIKEQIVGRDIGVSI